MAVRGRRTSPTRGIDLDVAVAGRYPGGATAALTASMTSHSPRTATVATEHGLFDLRATSTTPTAGTVDPLPAADRGAAGDAEWIEADEPLVGLGYGNEIVEVHRCLRAGRADQRPGAARHRRSR